jgi:ribose transport system substrate-binding protein
MRVITNFRNSLLLALAFATVISQSRADYQIAVIPMGTTHEYWKSIEAGAMKAKLELAARNDFVTIIWKGPLREDDREQQIQVVENFIGRKVSAIVLAPLDSRALCAPVEEATREGIPVVIVDSPLHSKAPVSTIATDNFKGGQLGGRRLGKVLGGRGRVVMLRCQAGSASSDAREAGFLAVMKSEFPEIVLLSTNQYGGITTETAFLASQNLINRFGDQIDGVFTPNESTANGMLLALREGGLAGKVRFVAFDVNDHLVKALEQGDVQGLVAQDPVKMGYLGVLTAVAALRHEKFDVSVDTGVCIVTRENMNEPAIAALLHPPLAEYLR